MTPNDFEYLRDLLEKASGLVLSNEKQYLIESRLAPVAKKLNHDGVDSLVKELRRTQSSMLKSQIVEAMTINESFFFRDKVPFDNFENTMLPNLLERNAKTKQIRIWSAAASTGQEAYSLAMILSEQISKLAGWRIEIIGTDLCSEALEKAKAGIYTQFEVQRGMPVKYLVKNFEQVGSIWHINPSIRSMVKFRQFNLLDSFNVLGRFDIIFCRNVLIYFGADTKRDILSRMAKQTNQNCYLVLGASETLVGISDDFARVEDHRGLYEKAAVEEPVANKIRPSNLGTTTTMQPLLKTGA